MADPEYYRKKKAKCGKSHHGMLSTASRHATDAGARILEKGGNAVDAAVAAAFCLGVTEPQASGLGGQSMFLVHLKGSKTIALDGSSRAPFAVVPGRQFTSGSLNQGIRATTIPSTPAALGYILDTYGTMPLGKVLQPAIEAARRGYNITAMQNSLIGQNRDTLKKDRTASRIFLKKGKAPGAGYLVRQPQLADCLERMAAAGWQDFYIGEIAEKIIEDMHKRGGLIKRADLSQIPIPVERQPLYASYRGCQVITFPPPGAGGALAQILNILECFEPEELDPASVQGSLILALAFSAALQYREKTPVDPALFPQSRHKEFLDKDYARKIACHIRKVMEYAGKPGATDFPLSGETTHISAADASGNCVGITQSIEMVFGAKMMSRDLGFFYNNYMSAFEYRNMMHPNYLLPGGRPWSSVAPTLLLQGGREKLLLGSPGSERIATSLAQVISRVLDFAEGLVEAVEAPRLHAGSTGAILIEIKRFAPEVSKALYHAGFDVKKRGAYSYHLGCVQAVAFPGGAGDPYIGVSDPRRDGTARGPKHLPENQGLHRGGDHFS